jgi:hypothetical protein
MPDVEKLLAACTEAPFEDVVEFYAVGGVRAVEKSTDR